MGGIAQASGGLALVFTVVTVVSATACYDYSPVGDSSNSVRSRGRNSDGDPERPSGEGVLEGQETENPGQVDTGGSSGSDEHMDSGSPTSPTSPAPTTTTPAPTTTSTTPPPPACKENGLYCVGGNMIQRCKGGAKTEVVMKCANGCDVKQPAQDDACKAPTPCVAGGDYCGGDKINGHPNVLYDCGQNGATTVVKQCTNGCVVAAAGSDDYCR